MFITLVIMSNLLILLIVLAWMALRRLRAQLVELQFLQGEKQKFDTLTTFISNTITNGGWLTVMHNGTPVPFGVLLDKMEPVGGEKPN
jgi:hypothetical protein